jgi:hypothetical protein
VPLKVFKYDELADADLVVDAIYEGAANASVSAEPLSRIIPGIGNMGGFRGSGRGADKRIVVLYTSGEDTDWPDTIDSSTGQFTYFGDNKSPGFELHETPRGGNRILRRVFGLLHEGAVRAKIPPFFIFQKYPTDASARSVQFKGVAVPGAPALPATSDLVALWKSTDGARFQNYRAIFTILCRATGSTL